MAGNLGSLVVELSANLARFTSDMGKAVQIAQKASGQIQTAFKALGVGISVAGVTAFVKSAIDAADALSDLRTRTGLAGQELLILQGAAVRGGAGLEAVSDLTTKLARGLPEAAKGTGDMAAAFQAMGISVQKAGGGLKSVDEILREVGEKFKTYEDGANKAALANAALGKGGDKLIPLVEAIKETEERFKRLGITISEDLLTQADKFNDTLEDLRSLSAQTGRQIATALLPHLQQLVDAMIEFKKAGGDAGEVVNALIGPIKILATGFLTLYEVVASSGESIAAFAAALTELRKGNIKAALDELDLGGKRIEDRFGRLTKTVSALFGETPGAGPTPPKTTRRQAPGVPDLAAIKAGQDALTKLQDQRAKLSLELLKDAGKQEQAVLDARYQANLVGEADYWAKRQEIQERALKNEITVLDDQIGRQQKLVNDAAKKGANTKDYYEALGNLEESLIKRNRLEMEFANQTNLAYTASARAARDYQNAVEEVNIQIQELRGNTADAAARRQDLADQEIGKRFASNRDDAALRQLETRRQLIVAQAKFNEVSDRSGDITTRLGINEERIQNSLRVGAISEIDALKKTGEARKNALDQLEAMVLAQEAIAKASDNPKLILQAEQARAALEKLRTEVDLLAQKFDTIIKDSFSDAFAEFISGTKKGKEAFNDFAKSVANQINRLVAQAIATDLSSRLGINGTGGGASGFGSLLASLFGGAIGSSSISGAATASSFASALSVPSYDIGTNFVPRDGLAMVHKGEAVIPANQNRSHGSVVVNVYAQDANSFRASRGQIAAQIDSAVAVARRRYR